VDLSTKELDSSGYEHELVAGFCKNGNEIAASIKEVKLLTIITISASSFQAKYAL
jgi:hypothetical protein